MVYHRLRVSVDTIIRTKDEKYVIDSGLISQKVIQALYSGITTEEVDVESAKISMNMSTIHPTYGNIAGRILVSNLHKKTTLNFVDKMNFIQKDTVYHGKNLLDESWLKWINENSFQNYTENIHKISNHMQYLQ